MKLTMQPHGKREEEKPVSFPLDINYFSRRDSRNFSLALHDVAHVEEEKDEEEGEEEEEKKRRRRRRRKKKDLGS